ncbi:uncharacterized protein LOC144112702 [Amblyomma americanum]
MEGGALPLGSTSLAPRVAAEGFWRPFAPDPDSRLHCAAKEALRRPEAADSRRRRPVALAPSPNSAFRPVRVKRLWCSYCGVSFLNNGQLVGHIRVHTGDRPYKCEACERAFARNEELTRHRLIHSGDKPHACDVCAKRFARKDHLSKHRKTHLDEAHKRVHVCSQPGCGHRYTRTDALTRHQWTAHAIRRDTSHCRCRPPDATISAAAAGHSLI